MTSTFYSRSLETAVYLLGLLLCISTVFAQEPGRPYVKHDEPQLRVPNPVPVPAPRSSPVPKSDLPDPADPAPQDFFDPQLRVSFHLASGWNLSRRDHEVSTFHLDARTAPPTARLKAVASIAFNPYPLSTFSGAFFYLSVTPRSSESSCAAQAQGGVEKPLNSSVVGKTPFTRGLDEHGQLCTETRNVTYTAMRKRDCLRFDLTVNTFCGGDVSGVQELTAVQLATVFQRMEGILETVQFDPK